MHSRLVVNNFKKWTNVGPKYRSMTSSAITLNEREVDDKWQMARPYEEIPGPKPLPLIGNIFRYLPHIGMNRNYYSFKISIL